MDRILWWEEVGDDSMRADDSSWEMEEIVEMAEVIVKASKDQGRQRTFLRSKKRLRKRQENRGMKSLIVKKSELCIF